MFISAAGALTVRHLKTNSPTIITLNIDLYFIVFSFHSFGFMIIQIILLFLQLFDYNRFLFFFPPFMVLCLLTAGQAPIFLIFIPNSGAY